VWNGASWDAAPVPPFPYNRNYRNIRAFRDPAVLYLGTSMDVFSDLVAWDGSTWTRVLGYSNPKGGNGIIDFGYRSGAAVRAGGLVHYSFSTHLCGGQFALLSQISAIAVGNVDGVAREFVGGPCLNETLGHVAMSPGNAASWTTVGDGLASVNCLQVFDDGNGPALFAGTGLGLQRWVGGNWTTVSGLNGDVLSMTVFDDGSGPGLFVSGGFTVAGGVSAVHVARWGRKACFVNCDGSFGSGGCPTANALDFTCFMNRFQSGDPRANCDGSTTPPILTANDFMCFLTRYVNGCT